MTDRAGLREKVMKLYADKWGVTDAWLADAAIDIVLEEAAKVAEEFPAHNHGNLATAPAQAAEQAADEIAAALRAYVSASSPAAPPPASSPQAGSSTQD